MKTFPVRWLAGLLMGALLVSACYGSTRPVIKIGLIAPFEELYRDDGYEVLNAVKLAVNQRNAAGGVAGSSVALVALNDNGRGDEAQTQAAKMAVDPDILGVIGPVKEASLPAGPALTARQVPWISLTETPRAQLAGGFSLAMSPDALVAAAVDALQAQPDVQAVQVYTDWPVAVPSGAEAESLASAAAMTAEAGLGAVWLGDAAGGARLAVALGSGSAIMGGTEVGSHIFLGRAGTDAAPAAWLSAAPDVSGMPQDFVAAYRALAGAVPGPQALVAYDAANMLLDAINLAGTGSKAPDRAAVQQALLQLGMDGWDGSTGVIRWETGCQLEDGCGRRMDGPVYRQTVR
ncbi:MAG: ABC transporter substrate-binding protein [Caldilineales bacterium]